MRIEPFKVEEWMNAYETGAKYNIAETCAASVSLDELFALTGESKAAFMDALCARPLTYGDITGAPDFLTGVCRLYRTLSPGNIIPTHGAAGANHHVFYSLVEPADTVVSVAPTYQQLYSIPESFGANTKLLRLTRENGYLPDLVKLKELAVPGTKMICINNPNNPTGALMDKRLLLEIIDIADSVGAYVLSDEVYRGLTQADGYSESVADLYDKGISVGSMSKVFSLAGLRLGWLACRDESVIKASLSHRDYNLISCGVFDEALSAVALKHADLLLTRNRGIVRENLAILDDFVRHEKHLSYFKPQAGTTALVHYDFDLPSYEFSRRLYETTGALVTPGDCFEESRCFRIGYACRRDELTNGLAAMHTFLSSLSA